MGFKDYSSRRQSNGSAAAGIRPGDVVLAPSPQSDVEQPRPQPYLVLFCKQEYVISLPFTSLSSCGSFEDACRYHEREPDTYYPIEPHENGIYDPIIMVSGTFSGYIDLLCPTTLERHTMMGGRIVGRMSHEALTRVADAHKGLLWDLAKAPRRQAPVPPLACLSPGTPCLWRPDPSSTPSANGTPMFRHYNRHGPHSQGDRSGGDDKDSGDLTVHGYRKTSSQYDSRRYERQRRKSREGPLKRTRHHYPDSRDTTPGTENRSGGEHLGGHYTKSAEYDCNSMGVLEDVFLSSPRSAESWTWSGTSSESEGTSEAKQDKVDKEDILTLSPTSAKSWTWLDTSRESDETSEVRGGKKIRREDMGLLDISSRPQALPMVLPINGRELHGRTSRLTRCISSPSSVGRTFDASTPTNSDSFFTVARNLLANFERDTHYESTHRYLA